MVVERVFNHYAGICDLGYFVLSFDNISLPGHKDLAFISKKNPFRLIMLVGKAVELQIDRRR